MLRFTTVLPALAALGLAACGGDSEPEEPAPPGTGDTTTAAHAQPGGEVFEATSARGTFSIVLEPEGGGVPLNEPFAMRVWVKDTETGEPLEGADEITLDARMPIHGHGMLYDVELEKLEGSYRAEGLKLHMVGPWEFHVDVRRGASIERAQVGYVLSL